MISRSHSNMLSGQIGHSVARFRRLSLTIRCARKQSGRTGNSSSKLKSDTATRHSGQTSSTNRQERAGQQQSKSTKASREKRRAKAYQEAEANGFVAPSPPTDGERKHVCGYVALVGKPNAGKSTLTNALLGQKLSIVTRKPQTTRHRILGILSDDDYQMILLDTPGVVQDMRNKLEERMMKNVKRAMEDADAVLLVIDASDRPEELVPLKPADDYHGPPICAVLNKVDLLSERERQDLMRLYNKESNADAVLLCCAQKGEGMGSIQDWMRSRMPEGPALYDKDVVSESPERFFIAEIVREHVFLQYQEEIPYCVAVQCVDYKERTSGKDYVEVTLYVERDRQKAILLGKGGSSIKQLATAARADIEEFVGRPVYLVTNVKVKDKWRKDDELLEQLGY